MSQPVGAVVVRPKDTKDTGAGKGGKPELVGIDYTRRRNNHERIDWRPKDDQSNTRRTKDLR